MYNLIRLLFALFIVILITPQTHKENLVLRKFHDSGLFMNYSEAKSFLQFITWFSIILFMILILF